MTELAQVCAYLETKYPEEGCGLIFHEADGSAVVHPMENVYDRYHAKDPATYPRDNRTAYHFSPLEFLRLSEAAAARGAQLAYVFHSHCDVGAYFSAEDVELAAPDGHPQLPGTSYLVVAVDQGRATAAKLFRWRGGRFVEEAISNPEKR